MHNNPSIKGFEGDYLQIPVRDGLTISLPLNPLYLNFSNNADSFFVHPVNLF